MAKKISSRGLARLKRRGRLVERALPLVPQFERRRPLIQPRNDGRIWLDFRNDSGELMPPRAVLEIDMGLSGDEYLDGTTPIIVALKPSRDHIPPWQCAINNDSEVEPDAYGKCTFDPTWAYFDNSGSTVRPGNPLGTANGQWYLSPSKTGFRALSGEFPGVAGGSIDAKIRVASYDKPHWGHMYGGSASSYTQIDFGSSSEYGMTGDTSTNKITVNRRGFYKHKITGYAVGRRASGNTDSTRITIWVNGAASSEFFDFYTRTFGGAFEPAFHFSYHSLLGLQYEPGDLVELKMTDSTPSGDTDVVSLNWSMEELPARPDNFAS